MKYIFSSFFFVLFCFLAPDFFPAELEELSNSAGRECLEKAIEISRNISYIAEGDPKAFRFLPGASKFTLFRYCDENGFLCLREEIYDEKDNLQWVFLKNEDGQFVIHSQSGKVAKVNFLLPLFYFESILFLPRGEELSYANFSLGKAEVSGRSCRKLMVRIPHDAGEEGDGNLYEITGFIGKDINQQRLEHPFVRLFYLDEETGCLLRVQKYNFSGKKISDIQFPRISFPESWEKYEDKFCSPKKIHCQVDSLKQFQEVLASAETSSTKSSFKRRSQAHYWRFVFLLVGVSCLSCAILKRRSRN
ncbi:MAG: hypothetical protein MJ202_02050 [Lentisphaeria bacterium]|nr:hypothetical protein [Lentisphaeria bacterium]